MGAFMWTTDPMQAKLERGNLQPLVKMTTTLGRALSVVWGIAIGTAYDEKSKRAFGCGVPFGSDGRHSSRGYMHRPWRLTSRTCPDCSPTASALPFVQCWTTLRIRSMCSCWMVRASHVHATSVLNLTSAPCMVNLGGHGSMTRGRTPVYHGPLASPTRLRIRPQNDIGALTVHRVTSCSHAAALP